MKEEADDPNGPTSARLARLDERLKALAREVQRTEDTSRRELTTASVELGKHLEQLNHHQSEMRDQQAKFIERNIFDLRLREADKAVKAIEHRLDLAEGRAWIVYVAVVAAVAALVGVMVKFIFNA